METKHTPGPWHRNIAPATKYNTVWSGRNTHVARVVVDGLPADQVEANIRLIAAAPDMLRALEQIERLGREADGSLVDVRATLADIARSAIAIAIA